jgi:hypothetical protein
MRCGIYNQILHCGISIFLHFHNICIWFWPYPCQAMCCRLEPKGRRPDWNKNLNCKWQKKSRLIISSTFQHAKFDSEGIPNLNKKIEVKVETSFLLLASYLSAILITDSRTTNDVMIFDLLPFHQSRNTEIQKLLPSSITHHTKIYLLILQLSSIYPISWIRYKNSWTLNPLS